VLTALSISRWPLLDAQISRGNDVFGDAEQVPIKLFGTPRYGAGSQAFFPLKGFVLIAALVLAPGQTLTRQAAASLLWENASQKRALGNLRQLLLRLQQCFGNDEPAVIINNNDVAAGPTALRSDLSQFLSAVRAGDVETRRDGILGMDGDLLDGTDVDGEQFYLWIASERNRLRELFFNAVAQLLEDVTRFGGRTSSLIASIADCALRLEPDREETYRNLMSAYARTGDHDASERIFESLGKRLRSEDRAPEASTIALRRRLKGYVADSNALDIPPERPTRAKPRVAFLPPVSVDKRPTQPIVQAFIEDVANTLVRYRTFRVLAPHSSFAAARDAVGESYQLLRADYRVQSTVFDNTRLSIALIEENSSEIIWSLEVALNERQIYAAFRLLSKQIAAALAERLERYHVEQGRHHDSSAYIHLLSGQQLLRGKCDLPLLRRARAEFRKAVDLDSGMAAARARIGQSLQLEWLMLGGSDPHLLHRANAEAKASIDIDPTLGIGHWMCAVVALYQRNFDVSAEKFFEAEALAPNSADLLIQHADALAHFGEHEEAWSRFQTAIDLNPLAPDIYWWAGASIALKREDYSTAVQLCGRMENDESALRILTVSHSLNGDLEMAKQYGRRLQENYPEMTARQLSLLSPNRDPAVNEKFYQAYRSAGIK